MRYYQEYRSRVEDLFRRATNASSASATAAVRTEINNLIVEINDSLSSFNTTDAGREGEELASYVDIPSKIYGC